MTVVEPDRQSAFGLGRNDIMRRIADVEIGKLDIARLEPVGPFVQLKRINLGENLAKLGDRIVRIVRIGDMALHAVHRDPHIDRTAPSDFHHVAEPVDRCRLADEAEVRDNTALGHQIHYRDGAEPRRAFFVPGDDQADRAEIIG